MATAGLVLGWTAIALFALLIVVFVLASAAYTTHGGPSGLLGNHVMLTPKIVPAAPAPPAP
jgi:hypothetical protein